MEIWPGLVRVWAGRAWVAIIVLYYSVAVCVVVVIVVL